MLAPSPLFLISPQKDVIHFYVHVGVEKGESGFFFGVFEACRGVIMTFVEFDRLWFFKNFYRCL
jgi:hypothetical protein